MRIGIVGARLSGSYACLLLAQMGHEVLLVDSAPETEKPCGGGVTSKALRSISWLREQSLPHNEITHLRLSSREGYSGDMPLRNPIHIYARATLDNALRQSACAAGARFLQARAFKFTPYGCGWVIHTSMGEHDVDFLVGADGATSSVRASVAGRFKAEDLSLAMGYYVPGRFHPKTVLAAFQEKGFRGYLWSFPRIDHSSVGILRWLPEANAAHLRRTVSDFIATHYPEASPDQRFYAARIPCLCRRSLLAQRVCGVNWALVGDAAGFADAITAEGIYYALRSAELLARAVAAGDPMAYERSWREDFGRELLRAAAWRDRFYAGTFLFRSFIQRALQMTRRSPTVRCLADALISGQKTYGELGRNLWLRSPRILVELLCHRRPS